MNFARQPTVKKAALLTAAVLLILILATGCLEGLEAGPEDITLHRVRITRVVDGDTAYARFSDGREEKVRFIGIDAPEINHHEKGREPFGPEAEEYAREVLTGRRLYLEFDLGERDQYGRLLAYLWLEVPERLNDQNIRAHMFNAIMLTEGYAVQVTFKPNVKYFDYFSAYEAEAKRENRGLWALKVKQ